MNYELKVTETNNKAAKFIYQVIDEAGNVITERKSNKLYVACTADGVYFFGRLDLIGKGKHGAEMKVFVNNPEKYKGYELRKTIAYKK
jgi:hypothetical protein